MTKQDAIRKVSDGVAAWLSASDLEDVFDTIGEISEDDVDRLEEAMDIVERRLWRMGGDHNKHLR